MLYQKRYIGSHKYGIDSMVHRKRTELQRAEFLFLEEASEEEEASCVAV